MEREKERERETKEEERETERKRKNKGRERERERQKKENVIPCEELFSWLPMIGSLFDVDSSRLLSLNWPQSPCCT